MQYVECTVGRQQKRREARTGSLSLRRVIVLVAELATSARARAAAAMLHSRKERSGSAALQLHNAERDATRVAKMGDCEAQTCYERIQSADM
jgi:hypothetical protein